MTTPDALTATTTTRMNATTMWDFDAPVLAFSVYAGARFFTENRGVHFVSPGFAPAFASADRNKNASARISSETAKIRAEAILIQEVNNDDRRF